MYTQHIELIPNVLKPSRYSRYDGESFTALEYCSKVADKMNECINEFNKFIDEVVKDCTDFKNNTNADIELFQRGMEQKFQDFIKVITLKYENQDMIINDAVNYMKANLLVSIGSVVEEMVIKGELNEELLNAIGNLQTSFDNTTNFVNDSVETLTNQTNSFIENQTIAFNNYKTDMTAFYENWVNTFTSMFNERTEDVNAAISEAYDAAGYAQDCTAELALTINELDGMYPDTDIASTDYDGGNIMEVY